MDIQKLKTFFMWCTIINGALLVLVIAACLLGADLWYGLHGQLFHISRENVGAANYLFLGLYKIVWLVFNAVPYVALLIVGKNRSQ